MTLNTPRVRSVPAPTPYLMCLIWAAGLMTSCTQRKISEEAATKSAIRETVERVRLHLRVRESIPLSMEGLISRSGYSNASSDGWGRRLLFQWNPEHRIIEIASLGEDGEVGGVGLSRDFSARMRLGELPCEVEGVEFVGFQE